MTNEQLEQKVTELAATVAAMQKELAELKAKPKTGWLSKVAGRFANNPDYDEAVRIGRFFREHGRLPGDDDVLPELEPGS